MPHIHFTGSARTIACLLVVTSCTRAVIAAQNTSTSEQLTADTPKQTTAGATFIAPAGWTFSVRGPATILAPPEGDSHIALVDVRAPTADSAVALAWAAYMPAHTWPLRVVTPSPTRTAGPIGATIPTRPRPTRSAVSASSRSVPATSGQSSSTT